MKSKENSYYDSIMTGLNEALEVSKGNLMPVKRRKVTVSPVPDPATRLRGYSAT